jgi:hypothetical protein
MHWGMHQFFLCQSSWRAEKAPALLPPLGDTGGGKTSPVTTTSSPAVAGGLHRAKPARSRQRQDLLLLRPCGGLPREGIPRRRETTPLERPDTLVQHETNNEQHARYDLSQWREELRNNVLLHFSMPPKPRPKMCS